MEQVKPVQKNIYHSNTHREHLSWLQFNDEPRVQERQQMKNQHSKISVFVAYLMIIFYEYVICSPANLFIFWCPGSPTNEFKTKHCKSGRVNYPANIYLIKVNNRNTWKSCEICSKLKIKTPYFTPFFNVSVIGFEQGNISWVVVQLYCQSSLLHLFCATGLFLYKLKTSENQRFSVFREYRKKTSGINW